MKKILFAASLLAVLPMASAYSADVIDGWARASFSDQTRNGAAYMTITNPDTQDDSLLSAASDIADVVEIHNMTFDEGVMRMFEVEKVEIPAGETIKFEPGSYHVMLMGLKKPLRIGETFDVILTFENAAEKIVPVEVHPRGGKTSPAGEKDRHHHH